MSCIVTTTRSPDLKPTLDNRPSTQPEQAAVQLATWAKHRARPRGQQHSDNSAFCCSTLLSA
eukprot:9161164-Alexandrium_andersonii.AAC.1